MKKLIILSAGFIASVGLINAQNLVAGWDFSQAQFSGTTAGEDQATPGNFSSNYTYGGGPTADSADWAAANSKGAIYCDGQFGSTSITDPLDGTSELQMTQGVNLSSNFDQSFDPFNAQSSYNKLIASGQNAGSGGSAVDALMNINTDLSIVVSADAGIASTGWIFKYAARDQDNGATVNYSYSTTGSGYTSLGSDSLATSDTGYELNLSALDGASQVFIKMDFSGVNDAVNSGLQLDNFGLSAAPVPEPSAFAAIFGAVALGIAAVRRRKHA